MLAEGFDTNKSALPPCEASFDEASKALSILRRLFSPFIVCAIKKWSKESELKF
jgi:hypothetical protein